jgi:hypothetical protein
MSENEMVERVAVALRASMPGLQNPEAWPWETVARAAIAAMPGWPAHGLLSALDDASNACLELAAKHSFATGHGDTVADMIREFSAQIAGWRTMNDEENLPPADQDVQLGWWRDFPNRVWQQKVGYARSSRGGWLDGQATHWMPLPSPPEDGQ